MLWLLAASCTGPNPYFVAPMTTDGRADAADWRGADADGPLVDQASDGPDDAVPPPPADAAAPLDGPADTMSLEDAAAEGSPDTEADAGSPPDLPPDTASPIDAPTPDVMEAPAPDLPPPCPGNDEDGDGFPDACDNCPADPNSDQANVMETNAGRAADGLGDACDPRPTESGDSLLFFDAFAGSSLDPAWTDDRSVFSVAGGNLVFDRPGDTDVRSLRRGMGTHVLVNTRFTFVKWGVDGDADVNQNLFIGVRGNASNGDDVRCSARRASTGANTTSVAYFEHGDASAPATTVPTPLLLGTSYRLITMVRGSEIECSIGAARINMSGVPTVNNGFLQIRVRNIAVHIQNIVAYQLAAP